MSARAEIQGALVKHFRQDDDAEGRARRTLAQYDADHRAEVFAEAIAALQGLHDLAPDGRRAPQLAFSVGVLIGARDFPAGEKSSREADATPEFFRPGRLYAYDIWRFQCATVAVHPETGERVAIGWIRISDGSWTTYAYSAAEWGVDLWADVTEGGDD